MRAEDAEKEVQIKVTFDPSTGSSGAPTLSTSIPSCTIAFNFYKFTGVMSLFVLPGTINSQSIPSIASIRSTGKILRIISFILGPSSSKSLLRRENDILTGNDMLTGFPLTKGKWAKI